MDGSAYTDGQFKEATTDLHRALRSARVVFHREPSVQMPVDLGKWFGPPDQFYPMYRSAA